MKRIELVKVAIGKIPCDILIKGGKLVNVHTHEIYPVDVAIKEDRIAYVGDAEHLVGPETKIIDAESKYLVPGLIETHFHEYETQLAVEEFAKVFLERGTTTLPVSFYGMGIVRGTQAIKFFYDRLKNTSLRTYFLVPTLTYLQNRDLGLPRSPYTPEDEDFLAMLDWEGCIGIEEPPFLPLVKEDPVIIKLYERALEERKVIIGHACELTGRELNAYIAAGTISDHEAVSVEEAIERARLGLNISIREGSGMPNLKELVKAITYNKIDSRAFNFCNDVASPFKLYQEGNIDDAVRKAIQLGVNPITAVQMASLNSAQVLGLGMDLGSIVPGKYADIILVNDLESFVIDQVIVGGNKVVENGNYIGPKLNIEYPSFLYNTVELSHLVQPSEISISVPGDRKYVEVRCIDSPEDSIITPEIHVKLPVSNGYVKSDISNDILKIIMVNRYKEKQDTGIGFVRGFNLKEGAIATTYNPNQENIIAVGASDEDICFAINHIADIGGGLVVVKNKKVLSELQLPVLGLLSDQPLSKVLEDFKALKLSIHSLGCKYKEPFHKLAFIGACGEIGILKITPYGLFNVHHGKIVSTVINKEK